MAKTEGSQSIPSALLDEYRATLGEQRPNLAVHKRVPYRLPNMQEGKSGETPGQRVQRARFKIAMANFDKVPWATRQRWYAARPPWSSLLWYYNYFIMSDLMGNADPDEGGAGVISSIQHKLISIGAGSAEGQVAITAIDIAKVVVMISGASIAEGQTGDIPYANIVYPYVSSIASELIKAKWSIAAPFGDNTKAAVISIIVIEYI